MSKSQSDSGEKNGPIIGKRQVNTINQFESTLKGLSQLKNDGFSGYVIKIRTDVSLDFKLLFKDIEKVVKLNKKVFIVPYFINRRSFKFRSRSDYVKRFFNKYELYMLDFVFVAELNDLINIIMNGLDNITSLSGHRFLLTLLNYTRGYKFSLTKWEFLGFRNWPWLISSYINLFLFAVSYLHEKKFNRLVYDYFYTLSQSTVLSLFLRNSCYSEWHEINKYNYEFLEL